MTVPTDDQFIEPLLRDLAAQPGEVRAADAHEAAAAALGISAGDRLVLLPSGMQPMYKNRAGWAHDRLKRAGLSTSPRRGYWRVTDEGRRWVEQHPSPLSARDIERLATGCMEVRLRPMADPCSRPEPLASALPAAASSASPEERLGEARDEMRRAVADELLETLGRVSPSCFESIVLDLLHRVGYGATRSDLQRVGGSGDGGIDGVIWLDRLGLEKVCVQAKRWQGTVGRPEVQAFYRALAGQRAHKGVLITTSTCTAQAHDFARSVERIVLVDGPRLAGLMIDHDVGVSSRTLKVPRIDGDHFGHKRPLTSMYLHIGH